MADELRIEGEKVLDYASSQENYSVIMDFTKAYSASKGNNVEIYYIVGNLSSYKTYYYDNSSMPVFVGNNINVNVVNVTIDNNEYFFDFNKGEKFYFVITRELNGEKEIIRG